MKGKKESNSNSSILFVERRDNCQFSIVNCPLLNQFITVSEAEATEKVELLINQAKQEVTDELIQRQVIELIEKVIVYKFPQKSRQELEKMFNLTEWRQTKFYQEAKEEGKLEGEEEGKLKTVPLLLKLGLTLEQIAQELQIEVEKIRQFVANQHN